MLMVLLYPPPSLPPSQLSRSIARYHQEKEMQHARAEKEDQLKLKKIASTIAKEIKHFWDSIQKVSSSMPSGYSPNSLSVTENCTMMHVYYMLIISIHQNAYNVFSFNKMVLLTIVCCLAQSFLLFSPFKSSNTN